MFCKVLQILKRSRVFSNIKKTFSILKNIKHPSISNISFPCEKSKNNWSLNFRSSFSFFLQRTWTKPFQLLKFLKQTEKQKILENIFTSIISENLCLIKQ